MVSVFSSKGVSYKAECYQKLVSRLVMGFFSALSPCKSFPKISLSTLILSGGLGKILQMEGVLRVCLDCAALNRAVQTPGRS